MVASMHADDVVEAEVVLDQARFRLVDLVTEHVLGTLEVVETQLAVGVDAHASSPDEHVTLVTEDQAVVETAGGLHHVDGHEVERDVFELDSYWLFDLQDPLVVNS